MSCSFVCCLLLLTQSSLIGITVYSLPGIVTAARVTAQKHFASDVVAGGTMGWSITRSILTAASQDAGSTHERRRTFMLATWRR
ncbi:MAG TPA: phosphatase PAP2 family protein [Candidatus Acidoferrum sp.]|nr:phosphatase PAP2 family protein [Candidatus Acidoferrum sp.]